MADAENKKMSPALEFIKRAYEETGLLAVHVIFAEDAVRLREHNQLLRATCNDWMHEVSQSPSDSPQRECFICRNKLLSFQHTRLGDVVNPRAIFVLRRTDADPEAEQDVLAGGLCDTCGTGTSREVAARIGAFISGGTETPTYTPEEFKNRKLH